MTLWQACDGIQLRQENTSKTFFAALLPETLGYVRSSFCHWEENILVLNILGRPRAKRNAIGKVIGKRLEIHVAENPARGKATAHLV